MLVILFHGVSGPVPGQRLLILVEIVLSPQFGLGLPVLVGEVGLPAGAEVDVPAPEAAEGRLGPPVVVGAELAVLAGVFSHNVKVFQGT